MPADPLDAFLAQRAPQTLALEVTLQSRGDHADDQLLRWALDIVEPEAITKVFAILGAMEPPARDDLMRHHQLGLAYEHAPQALSDIGSAMEHRVRGAAAEASRRGDDSPWLGAADAEAEAQAGVEWLRLDQAMVAHGHRRRHPQQALTLVDAYRDTIVAIAPGVAGPRARARGHRARPSSRSSARSGDSGDPGPGGSDEGPLDQGGAE